MSTCCLLKLLLLSRPPGAGCPLKARHLPTGLLLPTKSGCLPSRQPILRPVVPLRLPTQRPKFPLKLPFTVPLPKGSLSRLPPSPACPARLQFPRQLHLLSHLVNTHPQANLLHRAWQSLVTGCSRYQCPESPAPPATHAALQMASCLTFVTHRGQPWKGWCSHQGPTAIMSWSHVRPPPPWLRAACSAQ